MYYILSLYDHNIKSIFAQFDYFRKYFIDYLSNFSYYFFLRKFLIYYKNAQFWYFVTIFIK